MLNHVLAHPAWAGVGALAAVVAIWISLSPVNTEKIEPVNDSQVFDGAIGDWSIPLKIRNMRNAHIGISEKAEYFIVRPETPAMDTVVFSGIARISTPISKFKYEGFISLSSMHTVYAKLLIPKHPELLKYLQSRNYEIQVMLTNQNFEPRILKRQKIFDQETIKVGFEFIVRQR